MEIRHIHPRFGRKAKPEEVKNLQSALRQTGQYETVYSPFCFVYEVKPPYAKLDPRRLFACSNPNKQVKKALKKDLKAIKRILTMQPEESIKEFYSVNRYVLPKSIHLAFKSSFNRKEFKEFTDFLIQEIRFTLWDIRAKRLCSPLLSKNKKKPYSFNLDPGKITFLQQPNSNETIIQFEFFDIMEWFNQQARNFRGGHGENHVVSDKTTIKEAFSTLGIKENIPDKITREFFNKVIKPERNKIILNKRLHPDLHHNSSAEEKKKADDMMKKINNAYDLLEKQIR